MHGAKQSRVQWLRAQCSRAQHFRIVISNSSLEQPLRTHRRHRSRLEQPLRAHWRHRAGSNSLFERLFEPFCAFLRFFEPRSPKSAKILFRPFRSVAVPLALRLRNRSDKLGVFVPQGPAKRQKRLQSLKVHKLDQQKCTPQTL